MSERQSQKHKAKQRQAAALRENLRRRKAQAKQRMEGPADGRWDRCERRGPVDEQAAKPHDSAGFSEDK